MANTIQRDARNLAEATLRLITAADDVKRCDAPGCPDRAQTLKFYEYAKDDAEGEAKNILAKTEGA